MGLRQKGSQLIQGRPEKYNTRGPNGPRVFQSMKINRAA